jgi:brefeldin A-inhibited guanine nucleotide-exchange protein
MEAAELEHAAAVPLPNSPGVEGDETPNLLAQAAVVTKDDEISDARPGHTSENIEGNAQHVKANGKVVDGDDSAGTRERITDSDRPTAAATGDEHSEHPKELPTPIAEHYTPSPGPPTPSSKPVPIQRTDSNRSTATRDSVASPRNIPAPLPLHAAAQAQFNGRMSTSSPSPALVPPSPAGGGVHRRSLTMSRGNTVSAVLVSTALETIAASREAKRSQPLKEATQRALDMVKAGEGGDRPREIFEPLRLACETRNEKLMVASLDCMSKLISHSFFVEPHAELNRFVSPSTPRATSPPPGAASEENIGEPSLVDVVVHTVTSCHTETTSDAVSLQIVKALLSLVLSSTILVHHSSLLKVIRTVYNVFLLSADPVTQTVAQGGLTQMVHHVFTRCRVQDEVGSGGENTPSSMSKAASPSMSTTDSLPMQSVTPPPLQGYASSPPSSSTKTRKDSTTDSLAPSEASVQEPEANGDADTLMNEPSEAHTVATE